EVPVHLGEAHAVRGLSWPVGDELLLHGYRLPECLVRAGGIAAGGGGNALIHKRQGADFAGPGVSPVRLEDRIECVCGLVEQYPGNLRLLRETVQPAELTLARS